jgi:hypothetical protein
VICKINEIVDEMWVDLFKVANKTMNDYLTKMERDLNIYFALLARRDCEQLLVPRKKK